MSQADVGARAAAVSIPCGTIGGAGIREDYTVRDGQYLGHCPKFGSIANFKFGAMPQIWVKS